MGPFSWTLGQFEEAAVWTRGTRRFLSDTAEGEPNWGGGLGGFTELLPGFVARNEVPVCLRLRPLCGVLRPRLRFRGRRAENENETLFFSSFSASSFIPPPPLSVCRLVDELARIDWSFCFFLPQKRFVKGLRQYGKNFFRIRKDLLPHKDTVSRRRTEFGYRVFSCFAFVFASVCAHSSASSSPHLVPCGPARNVDYTHTHTDEFFAAILPPLSTPTR